MTVENDELMKLRGEYFTLEAQFKKLQTQMARDVSRVCDWSENMSEFKGNFYGRYCVAAEHLDYIIEVLQRIKSCRWESKEINAKLERLKPLCKLEEM